MQKKRSLPPIKVGSSSNRARGTFEQVNASLSDRTTVVVDNKELHLKFSDLQYIRTLGIGQFSTVAHRRVKIGDEEYNFAVKEIKASQSETPRNRIHQESEFGLRMSECPFAVITYGVMGRGDDVRILMEIMDGTVEELRHKRKLLHMDMPEEHIAFITKCVVKGLEYLRQCHIQHRDVKPTNMLVNRSGCVKICDYGVAQKMEGDKTKTNVGTFKFLAPERLVAENQREGFRIQSDVWSLGMSVYNIVTTLMPYPVNGTIMDYYNYIKNNSDVQLPSDPNYSPQLREFVSACLRVDEDKRPDYISLLEMDFLTSIKIKELKPVFAQFVCQTFEDYEKTLQ